MSFNKQKFAVLLEKAKGNRSINQYALQCGVSSAHISRLMRQLLDTPPNPETIKLFASKAHNEVTYNNLMVAAGYIEEDNSVNEDPKTIGENLKKYREKANFSEDEVAEKLNVSKSTYAEIESGKTKPDEHIIKEAANLYGVKTEKLLFADDVANENPISRAFHNYDNLTDEELEYLEMQLDIFRKMKKNK